jgi:O-antigen ligase
MAIMEQSSRVEAVGPKPSLWYGSVGVMLAVFMVITVWSLMPVDHTMIVLLAVLVLLLLGFKRPVWAVAALLVSQFTMPSHMVGTPFGVDISLRLLLLFAIGLILWRFRKEVELGPKVKRVIIPAVILLIISVIVNMFYSEFDLVFKSFRNMFSGLLIIIFIPAVVRNLKDLKILCGVAFIVMTASAVIGVLQHYQFLGADTISRVSGMSDSKLELMLILPGALLTVLGIFLSRGLRNIGLLLVVSSVMMGLALYFTYTRSALLALALGAVALIIFLLSRIRSEIILVVVLLGVCFIEMSGFMSDQFMSGRDIGAQQESSISRKILWQAGIAIVQDHPLSGIGGDQYKAVSEQYISAVDPDLLRWEEARYWGYRTLGALEPHNDFLTVAISYGLVALFAFLWLFMAGMRNLFDAYNASGKRFIKGLSVGLAAALIAYAVNVFYHNGLATLPIFWIIIGFSGAAAKIAARKRIKNTARTAPSGSR